MASKKIIIGQVGAIASGSWIINDLLKEHGFEYFSLSSLVREKAKEIAMDNDRRLLQQVGNKIRSERGQDYFAREISEKVVASDSEKILIDSLRTTEELEYLRKKLGAFILGIAASSDVRYKLMLARGNTEDPMNRKDFDLMDARDLGTINEKGNGHSVLECLK